MNGFSSAGDWSGDKAANSMKKQLTEVQAAFEEEKSKTKSLTDRLNVLRSEFNQTKSAQVGAQKMLEEMQVSDNIVKRTFFGYHWSVRWKNFGELFKGILQDKVRFLYEVIWISNHKCNTE